MPGHPAHHIIKTISVIDEANHFRGTFEERVQSITLTGLRQRCTKLVLPCSTHRATITWSLMSRQILTGSFYLPQKMTVARNNCKLGYRDIDKRKVGMMRMLIGLPQKAFKHVGAVYCGCVAPCFLPCVCLG